MPRDIKMDSKTCCGLRQAESVFIILDGKADMTRTTFLGGNIDCGMLSVLMLSMLVIEEEISQSFSVVDNKDRFLFKLFLLHEDIEGATKVFT